MHFNTGIYTGEKHTLRYTKTDTKGFLKYYRDIFVPRCCPTLLAGVYILKYFWYHKPFVFALEIRRPSR